MAAKKPRFLKKFLGFLVQRPNTKVWRMWKLNNKDEIDESDKSLLKFEYNVYLLSYTIEIQNLSWAFEVLGF